MRRSAISALLLALPALLAGCGDGSLIIGVDILSYLDPGERAMSYSVPGGMAATDADVASKGLNLLPGVEDATAVSSATLQLGASFDHQSGDATGVLRLYMAPSDTTDPFTTAPIDSVPVTLVPGNVTNVTKEITSDALANALVGNTARVGIRVTFDTTATPVLETAAGTVTITQLTATVITKKDF